MGRLLYHDHLGISGQSSPFDEAVLEVARSSAVGIVSPYIGVDYLKRVIQVCNGWRLITDIEAWLSSLSIRARPKAWGFIRENLECIHHCPAVHAKAVISRNLAMIGSANLTNNGILGRTEMGILIDQPALVTEIGVWFEALWQQTLPPIADETSAFIQWLDEEAEHTPARREKLSLSATSKKVRARLVELQLPSRPALDGTPLNLDAVAQSLVLQEQRHYDSLEETIAEAINSLAAGGFSLAQAVAWVHHGFPMASIRDIFFALVQHCANYVRSVFAENTRNRLIWVDGKFIQSTQEMIPQVLAPFDSFLVALIHYFDFSQFRDLPDEKVFEKQTGLRGRDQEILVSDLLDCGLLEFEDIAGHLPRYRLSAGFEWSGRYRLFSRAMQHWISMCDRPKPQIKASKPTGEDDLDHFETELDLALLPDEVFDDAVISPIWVRNPTDTVYAKAESSRIVKERREKIDKVHASILVRLFAGEQLPITKKLLVETARETGVGENLVRLIISGRGEDIPKVILPAHVKGRGMAVSVHPYLDWKDLNDYPLTRDLCKNFIDG